MLPAELRSRRHALGLSQAGLAKVLGVTGNTVARWEQGSRAIGRPELVRLALERVEEHLLARASSKPGVRMEHRLPRRRTVSQPATLANYGFTVELYSFVGRERETEELAPFLSTTRLLTLTGVGGVGKTRLARRVAERALNVFANGVVFVEFAALRDAHLVPHAVANALGLQEASGRARRDVLVDVLRRRHQLLIFDNCEHVVHACAELADELLRTCGDVVILATSREPLGLAGETIWQVPPLAVPASASEADSLLSVTRTDAGRLFVERAQAASPGLRLTENSAPAIARICQRLDGLPLALELAAARVRVSQPG